MSEHTVEKDALRTEVLADLANDQEAIERLYVSGWPDKGASKRWTADALRRLAQAFGDTSVLPPGESHP